MRFQACTIITRSYLPQARVLYRSFRQFHPDIPFSALVFDAPPGTVEEPFQLFYLQDIDLPAGEETRMPMLYNVTELATALKPWFFRHLFAQERTELLYFDPDVEIFSPVDRLANLAGEHCLVLTPHTTRPMTREAVKPNETDILSAGSYNLGFLGLNSDSGAFLDWWSERLLREAVIDIANMRFTDQRWMDFAPGYFDSCILRDETCNVAYWNADSRPLTWSGTRYEVSGQPLCFFHFSGFKPENPHLLSLHQHTSPRTRLSESPALVRICREYAEKLETAGYAELGHVPYGWETTPDGLKLTMPMRVAYRTALRDHEKKGTPAPPNAFDDSAAFIAWLNEPLKARRWPELTRYFWAIHAARPDVRAVYPNVPGNDTRAYYEWLRDYARRELPIPDELFPRPQEKASPVESPNESEPPSRGVTLTGYLRAEAGTGEAARLMALALEESGEKSTAQVWTEGHSRQDHPWDNGAGILEHHYDTNLICVNADRLPSFAHEVGPEFFANRHNIGLWFWEAEVFPSPMHHAFSYLHEVWVTSDFVRNAIAKVSPIPVFTIPLPLNVRTPVPPPPSRVPLSLPDKFIFLFSFDFFSVAERKNPVAVIEAFKQAFAPGEGPALVIKSINGDRNLAELERLYYARDERPDIIIRDGYLSAEQKNGLMAACDCYVSLHRSEGFGLTLAEAMLLEKPTIATRYSGNLEFMTDANSFLCEYELQAVGNNALPYPPDARWAAPKISEAAKLMRFVYENPEEAGQRGKRARLDLCAKHDPRVAGEFIKGRLSHLRRKQPAPLPFAAPFPERAILTSLRSTVAREVNVRETVPSLLTWILQGPRRAMKQFLRAYDQHQRSLRVSLVEALKAVDADSVRDRVSLWMRTHKQEDELHFVKRELQKTRERLSALEKRLHDEQSARRPGQNAGRRSHESSTRAIPEKETSPDRSKRDAPSIAERRT